MTTEKYSATIDKLLAKRGTSRIWLWRQFPETSRTHFWRRVEGDKLTKEEKAKIKSLLK